MYKAKTILIPVLFFCFTIAALSAFGQHYANFTHFMRLPSVYNPALLSGFREGYVAGQFRSQWVGYQNSFNYTGLPPKNQLVGLVLPIRGRLSGCGLTLVSEFLGPISHLSVTIPFAGSLRLLGGSLGIGIQGAVHTQTEDFDILNPVDPGDPLIAEGKITQAKFNLGAGISYHWNSGLYLGVSVLNILEPSFNFSISELENRLPRRFVSILGYKTALSRKLDLQLATYQRFQTGVFTTDVGGTLTYNGRALLGLTYRYDESINMLLGWTFLESRRLQVGYALDLVVQYVEAKELSSHEFFITYRLPKLVLGRRKMVKTPRFAH